MAEPIVVSELHIYPIKSTRGISLHQAQLGARGFERDRRWMIVDAEGLFISQRTHPRLALISTELSPDAICVGAPGMEMLKLPIAHRGNERGRVQVWDDVVEAIPFTALAHQWFSEFLGVQCRVVYMPDETVRRVNPPYGGETDVVSFADAFPVLLISQPSLDDLNTRLSRPVPMNRFRPNIVVRGCAPYDEDRWKKFRVGDVVFQGVKRCSRCVTTTVDQATGTRGDEPLATLARYRNVDGKVYFGQNLLPVTTGPLHVGDRVELIT